MSSPLGETGPVRVQYDGVDLGYTHGGVKFIDETMKKEITYDQTGVTVQNTKTTGKKVYVEVPLTNTSLTLLEGLIAGAVIDANGMIVSTSVGRDGRTNAKQLVLTIYENGVPSVDPDAQMIIFKADPTAKIDWGFDNDNQRVTLIHFDALPDDTSGNVGAMYRTGAAV